MAYSFNGTNQYLKSATVTFNTEPLTIAYWFKANSATASQEAMSVASGAMPAFSVQTAGAVTGDPIRAYKGASGVYVWADTTSGYNTSNTFHACGIFGSTTSRNAYINGGSKGTDTTSRAGAAGTFNVSIGAMNGQTYYNGMIAEAAVWNAALTDDEVVSLAKGFKPYRVRPQSLQFYGPLTRNAVDLRGASTITTFNSPTVADHPRVY